MGFRHLLEAHNLTQAMLIEINAMLIERGLLMSKGTLVDATLIAAPSSTKNQAHARGALLLGQEEQVGADAGYVGVEKREDMKATLATNEQSVKWRIAKRRKSIQTMADGWQKNLAQAYEKLKAKIRARVEHPFQVIKNIFKHKKTRYKGIAKNDVQLQMLFGLSNLYIRPLHNRTKSKSNSPKQVES